MSSETGTGTSVAGVHRPSTPPHPTLSDRQILAAHALAELPIGMAWKDKADRIGLDEGTLRAYRQDPEFMELVIKVSRENLRAEIPGAYQELTAGLRRGGTAGARYLELFFKLTGELVEQEQLQGLRTWLDLVADCSSDLLVVAIQRNVEGAVRPVRGGAGRVVASERNVAQRGPMELTDPPALGEVPVRGELDL